ncbi:MAG: ATP-binding protein [Bacteroidota bacterium]
MQKKDKFNFEISLSVLNDLGRNLYRSFITVLGEAISNAWDADAKNVWIYLDKKKNCLVIKDDGTGMSRNDFQNKFLKIGYSKRKDGETKSPNGRPYIGRKGIGKLALLSCARKITVISKTRKEDYVGGSIDNSGLDKAITKDLTPEKYPLGNWKLGVFKLYTRNHESGTIIRFEGMKEGVRHSLDFLKKTIALYFRFSLIDKSFDIFLDDEKITIECLKELAKNTQFLWNVNRLDDPYIKKMLTSLKEPEKHLGMKTDISGFVASVKYPSDLKVTTSDERAGVDLFVNGRLRERDILKHIPTARVAENYFYGQLHFDGLDDKKDRFATSREGIVANDTKYTKFLNDLKKKISGILTDWDIWRIKHREDGDPENKRMTRVERKSRDLYNAVSDEYILGKASKNRKKIDGWVDELGDDARYNFASYAECFISENLVRRYIQEKSIPLSMQATAEVQKRKSNETQFKGKAGISIDIRKQNVDLSYLSMDHLANLVDKKDPNKEACLSRDANEYKPVRDALMHTSLLTDAAKLKLTSVYNNIKGRVRTLLSGK